VAWPRCRAVPLSPSRSRSRRRQRDRQRITRERHHPRPPAPRMAAPRRALKTSYVAMKISCMALRTHLLVALRRVESAKWMIIPRSFIVSLRLVRRAEGRRTNGQAF
jgi:hypothetical protein